MNGWFGNEGAEGLAGSGGSPGECGMDGTKGDDGDGGAGGQGGGPGPGNAGGNGRFILGRNTTDTFGGTLMGTTQYETIDGLGRNLGSRAENPYVQWTETPQIPDLVGGAEAYGLTTLSATAPEFNQIFIDAPPVVVAALHVMDTGPSGLAQNWDGFDMLLLLNLRPDPLDVPLFGAGMQGWFLPLFEGGFENDMLFGGSGDEWVTSLDGYGVYATLIPEGTTDFNILALVDEGIWAYAPTLGPGESLYLVPEPATMVLLAMGGLVLLRQSKR